MKGRRKGLILKRGHKGVWEEEKEREGRKEEEAAAAEEGKEEVGDDGGVGDERRRRIARGKGRNTREGERETGRGGDTGHWPGEGGKARAGPMRPSPA